MTPHSSYTSPFSFFSYPALKKNNIPEQIQALSKLKDGWDFGEGIGISNKVVENACYIFNHFERSTFVYTVNPTSHGGIKITAQLGINFLDLTINSDLTIDITLEVGVGAEYDTVLQKQNVSMIEIESHLNELLVQPCFLSERYTSENITFSKKDSIAILSKTMVEEYPLLTWSVQPPLAIAYADIYNDTTII